MRWESDVRLAEHTRYGIGGPAASFGRVGSIGELAGALASLSGTPYRVLGWGANVLVADAGLLEAVLVLGGELDYLRLAADSLEAGAAAGLPALIGAARRAARSGFGFLEAVPGTVGGGLRMNAGSADVGLWERVLWADAMTAQGERVRLGPRDARPSYRRVEVPEEWIFLAACFEAPPADPEDVQLEHMIRRREKVEAQVYELPSCGSTWKNPGGAFGSAWQVVERVGMRGARRGAAQIAERHANFIVNLGGARAEDVLWLMRETRRRAHEEFGVWLEPEIRLWGFPPEELSAVGAAS